MKTILKNKWFIIVAAIFGFASFANASVYYHDSIFAAGNIISEFHTTYVPSTCNISGEIAMQGSCHGHIEVHKNAGQVMSIDSTDEGTVTDSAHGQPADTYYVEHWGMVLRGQEIYLSLRTYISWN